MLAAIFPTLGVPLRAPLTTLLSLRPVVVLARGVLVSPVGILLSVLLVLLIRLLTGLPLAGPVFAITLLVLLAVALLTLIRLVAILLVRHDGHSFDPAKLPSLLTAIAVPALASTCRSYTFGRPTVLDGFVSANSAQELERARASPMH